MEAVVADLHNQLGKKSSFESAATALASLFRDRYDGATAAEKRAMYAAACRAGSLLQSRYTGKGFWIAGQILFEEAGDAITDPQEQENMMNWLTKAREFLHEDEDNSQPQQQARAGPSSPFLFEGQLTVDPEPRPPLWLLAPTTYHYGPAQLDGEGEHDDEELEDYVQSLTALENFVIEQAVRLSQEQDTQKGPPPASKDEVAKLSIVRVTEEVLKGLGDGTECAVCREVLVVGDEMQEMPCKHYFHPLCLKPWLEEHNSCPVCRYEMRTDDHEYESRKEREAEAEAERKGAANALPGLDFMYV
ncbi:E3 ubiquitin-protein ligase AIP2 [Selaginella moellendorffii]|uniref:E3 ubiquitin-protein ligase AIP2 n=1 Tax=Selaginella moellendorffii TaxID=88036 RepID=UPI000D1C231F|nr:E3 ubiquitin-protein ligase AIP2 [Selaginella moellendorffii]|eukprot:XP_024518657.1 E3 ubiquitin-protein ligase AIP2 [Selaginella moellendorffii]